MTQQIDNNNDIIMERYQLAMERVKDIPEEACKLQAPEAFGDFFCAAAKRILAAKEQFQYQIYDHTMEELQANNMVMYGELMGDNYETSFANPAYAVQKLGKEYGQLLSFVYSEWMALPQYAREQRMDEYTFFVELFLEIYQLFQEYETLQPQQVQKTIYYFYYDYCDVMVPYRVREMFDPSLDYSTRIVMDSDLTDLRYLYAYGDYICENELRTAAYLNTLTQQEIEDLAFTYTDGYREGFEIAGIDLSKKKYVNVRYAIGQERMIRAAILQFQKLGLEPVIYKPALSRMNRRQSLRGGTLSTSPNRQYDYDHRMDEGIFLDKAYEERKLTVLAQAYEELKSFTDLYAGPAVVETFGEDPFEPVNKPENMSLTKKQQELSVDYTTQSSKIVNKYVKHEEYSFTIIAYPIPEIGDQFEEIFRETVKVNTLDKKLYRSIQQVLIDELDQAEHVMVEGKDQNCTSMKVMMHKLQNPEKETNFENCLADVNIPVGEVFTSPQLTGTEGILHVSEVFLNDLKFVDLKLTFQDGKILTYTCKNFATEEENQKFIKENLLMNRDTLPIGEFAIGTNTTAYVMANKYDIVYKLPILIVEKTGPHFAVGDTCYSYSEEIRLFNPDGKEIVAKENECSLLRKEDETKAYFNCHTDITIPYDEIGSIRTVRPDGTEVELIRNGRFVLPGTEELNRVFEE